MINYKVSLLIVFFILLFSVNVNAQNFESVAITGVVSGQGTQNALFSATSPTVPLLKYIRVEKVSGTGTVVIDRNGDNFSYKHNVGFTPNIPNNVSRMKISFLQNDQITPAPVNDYRMVINDIDGPSNEGVYTDCGASVRYTALAIPTHLTINTTPPNLGAIGTQNENNGVESRIMFEYNDVSVIFYTIYANNNYIKEFDLNYNDFPIATPKYAVCTADFDGDGINDSIDLDDDNDGITDKVECGNNDPNGDADGDGLPNYLDTLNNLIPSNNSGGIVPATYSAAMDGSITNYADANSDGVPDVYTVSTDNDGFPNHLDLDSDGDGCYDAIEGDENVILAQLNANGSINTTANGGIGIIVGSTNGVPNLVNSGGAADIGGDAGQGFNTSQNTSIKDSICYNLTLNPDSGTTANGISGIAYTVPNVLTNDTLDGVAPVIGTNPGQVTISQSGLWPAGITLNTTNGTVAVAASVPSGTYNVTYQVCVNGTSPALCTTTTVTIVLKTDTDRDGITNDLDLDDDNDGITDMNESGVTGVDPSADADNDGIPNYIDSTFAGFIDTNSDGVDDRFDKDLDGIPNIHDLDSDNDGILDILESLFYVTNIDPDGDGKIGTGNTPPDADGDGLADIMDPNTAAGATNTSNASYFIDRDGDGIKNQFDIDSDNDGIVDNIEGQSTSGYIAPLGLDTDNDGIDDAYDVNNGGAGVGYVNADGGSAPDYVDLDSDNDGFWDLQENQLGASSTPSSTTGYASANPVALDTNEKDANADGLFDGPYTDTDGDGLLDAFDNVNGILTPNNVTNNQTPTGSMPNTQTVSTPERDWRESLDSDGDGVADITDVDDDNDGILDTVEGHGDNDNDGLPNYLDLDSDNDGIYDVVEAGGIDLDNDGYPGTTPSAGPYPQVAANGLPTYLGGTALTPSDFDGDGLPNYFDLDSDNDGIFDVLESGGTDSNNDGLAGSSGFIDIDADGINDIVDGYNNLTHTTMGGTPLILLNTDGADTPNFIDTDSDGDGCFDAIEGTGNITAAQLNGSGAITGSVDATTGIPTAIPTGQGIGYSENSVVNCDDADGDGYPDAVDLDDDNDGILDSNECYATVIPSSIATTISVVPSIKEGNTIINYSPATTNYAVPVVSYNNVTGKITFTTATTGAYGGNPAGPQWGPDGYYGDISQVFMRANLAGYEKITNFNIGYTVGTTDDGYHVEVNDVIVTDFNNLHYRTRNEFKSGGLFDTNLGQPGWTPYNGEGNPAFDLNITAGTIKLMVNDKFGGRQDAIPYIKPYVGLFRPFPIVNLESGVKIGTTFSDSNGIGPISIQRINFSADIRISCDTDSDGTPDYLDTDSDNDGCPDAIEGSGNITSSQVTSGHINGGLDANGVPTAASGGQAAGESTDSSKNDCLDIDADGVPDWRDLDNDNDGILDTVENNCPALINLTNSNTDFSTLLAGGTVTVGGVNVTATKTGTVSSFAGDAYIGAGAQINPGFSGTFTNAGGTSFNTPVTSASITLNFSQPISSFSASFKGMQDEEQITFSQPASSVVNLMNSTYGVAPSIMSLATLVNGGLELRSNLSGIVNSNTSSSFGSNSVVTWNFPAPVSSLTISHTGVNRGTGVGLTNYNGSIIGGDFTFAKAVACTPLDTDGDGIINSLDPDSDGDGCPDAIEGAGNITNSQLTSGQINGGVDVNGVPNAVSGGQALGNSENSALKDPACYTLVLDTNSASGYVGTAFVITTVLGNDTLDGLTPVIGSNPGQIAISQSGVWPAGITLNADGTINVGSTVPLGIYNVLYQVCVNGTSPALCTTTTVTINITESCKAGTDAPILQKN